MPPLTCAQAFGGAAGVCIQDNDCPTPAQGDARCVSGFANGATSASVRSRSGAPRWHAMRRQRARRRRPLQRNDRRHPRHGLSLLRGRRPAVRRHRLVALTADGAACELSSDCVVADFCDANTGTCAGRKANGTACSDRRSSARTDRSATSRPDVRRATQRRHGVHGEPAVPQRQLPERHLPADPTHRREPALRRVTTQPGGQRTPKPPRRTACCPVVASVEPTIPTLAPAGRPVDAERLGNGDGRHGQAGERIVQRALGHLPKQHRERGVQGRSIGGTGSTSGVRT